MSLLAVAVALPWVIVALFIGLGCWIGFQLIHQNGRLLSRLEALEQQVAQVPTQPAAALPPALSQPPAPAAAPPPSLPLGSRAPEFELPDLEGRRRKLADFRGQELLLLF